MRGGGVSMKCIKKIRPIAIMAAASCLFIACPNTPEDPPPGDDHKPEIQIETPSAELLAVGGIYDFGEITLGASDDAVFTVRNVGDATLKLEGVPLVEIGGAGADQFEVVAEPSSSIPASSSSSFSIRFTPTSTGAVSTTVSIPNNDDDEAPFMFTVQGTGIEPEYPDTDGDGAPDYLEQALGTGVSDPADNPASRGYKVAILSEGSAPVPSTLSFTFTPSLSAVDVFILMDTTGSMDEELAELQAGLASAILPALGASVPDVAIGLGAYRDFPTSTYGNAGDYPFSLRHRILTVRTSGGRNSVAAALTSLATGGGNDTPESSWEALYQVATGTGFASKGGATVPAWNPGTAYPSSPPAGEQAGIIPGVGFRNGAMWCIVWITDAVGHQSAVYNYPYSGFSSPGASTVVAALNNIAGKVIGINTGGNAESKADQLFAVNATQTRVPTSAISASDASTYGLSADSGMYPLMLATNGMGTGLSNAIVIAVQALAGHGAFEVGRWVQDDTSDTVDVSSAFIDRTVAEPSGGQSALDTNSDGYLDSYDNISIGEDIVFTVVLKPNTTVSQSASTQLFLADLKVFGNGGIALGTQKIYLVVPPILH
jgi:hypothetical protein